CFPARRSSVPGDATSASASRKHVDNDPNPGPKTVDTVLRAPLACCKRLQAVLQPHTPSADLKGSRAHDEASSAPTSRSNGNSGSWIGGVDLGRRRLRILNTHGTVLRGVLLVLLGSGR